MELSDKVTEENVLALIMNAKHRDVIADVFARIDSDLFYYEPNKQLFLLLFDCYMAGEETTVESVNKRHPQEIKAISKKLQTSIIQMALGYHRLNFEENLMEKSEDMIGLMADSLVIRKKMRDLHEIQTRIAKGLDNEESPEKTYAAIETLLLKNNSSSSNRTYLSPKDMAMLMIEAASERMDKTKRDNEVMFTSYKQINYASGGLEKGNLVILSAGSGVGKSALAINLVRDVAYVSKKSVLYLNSEMTNKQQAQRYNSLLAKVSHRALRNGEITDKQFNKIQQVADDFSKRQIHTITIPDMQLSHVVAEIKRMKTRSNVEFVVVDYIGRMDISKSFGKDLQEWQVMEQIARDLKNLALELDIVILMVAQLSSNGETLAKSSSMKNECDLWLNLKRVGKEDKKNYYDATHEKLEDWWNVILEFRKARSAQFGAKVLMHFYGDELLFTDDEEEAKHFLVLEQNNVAHNRD
jgi:replicative DNA helicase